MGKLTYSARKISGIKAGQVVSKDLKKRQPPGIGAKAAARDPTLEIDLTGKCLTDEGFAGFIDDLLECIRYRDEQHPVGLAKVTEFYLQGNNLTVHSLVKLGEVITLSSGDIRELDLSQNDIRVESDEEKKLWKAFLASFKNCYILSKLDISGNLISPAGLEILACVYLKSDLEYLEADAEAIVKENHGDIEALTEDVGVLKVAEKDKENDTRAGRPKKSPFKGKAGKQNGTSTAVAAPSKSITIADLKKYACTRGLRSIPYFMLSDISLKNRSSVHLTRMLATQRASEQLLTFIPPVKASAIPEAAVDNKSLIWQPNEGLAVHAKRLLDVTESIREHKSKAQAESDADDSTDEDTQRKLQSKLALEYTRLTKRIRLEAMKLEGIHASDITSIAFNMKVVARALLLDDEDRPKKEKEEEPTEESMVAVEKPPESEVEVEEVEEEEVMPKPPSPPVKILDRSPYDFLRFLPVGRFHPAAAAFDAEFPTLPPTHKIEVPEEVTATPEKAAPESDVKSDPEISSSSDQRTRSTKASRSTPPKKARKSSWRFGLPFEIWRRIIADVVGAEGILDHEQQFRIIHYASSWEAVEYELTIKGAEEHQQIWKFLETVGCFTYSPLS
ncbi:hypothetical protein BJX70DRAFT_219764 [Aspergillus crustosus]